jgi:hypothetical protein
MLLWTVHLPVWLREAEWHGNAPMQPRSKRGSHVGGARFTHERNTGVAVVISTTGCGSRAGACAVCRCPILLLQERIGHLGAGRQNVQVSAVGHEWGCIGCVALSIAQSRGQICAEAQGLGACTAWWF